MNIILVMTKGEELKKPNNNGKIGTHAHEMKEEKGILMVGHLSEGLLYF